MITPAELWEQYQPRFAEAKLRDKEEQTLVFLIQPARVGRFLIAPLTLRRVLYLEAYRSPFIGGDAPLNKWSVLELLWVLSPQFTPSPFKRKLFFVRNYFCDAEKYTEMVGEWLMAGMELIGASQGEEEESPLWVAQLVETFASEYGWTIDYILDIPFLQLNILGKAMGLRLAMKSGDKNSGVKSNRNVDKVRADYLKETNRVSRG